MNTTGLHLAYFSATNTTRNLVRSLEKEMPFPMLHEYNLTNRVEDNSGEKLIESSELLIVGVPSYFGRVPELAAERIRKFKGDNTPAIIVCAYGNRDFDDTLLELRDIVSANGFRVIAAGAFVATHSIFPQVGAGRPDEVDINEQKTFAKHCVRLLNDIEGVENLNPIAVKGNLPYKAIGKIPFRPTGNKKCDACGTCVKMCPTEAIPADNPRKTDKDKCIACARCIHVCPQDARAFGGLIYKIARSKFVKKHQDRQPNVEVYVG